MPKLTPIAALQIGDVIQIAEASPYLSATVTQIDRVEGVVRTMRPYITYHHSLVTDTRMSPLMGMEEVIYHMSDSRGVLLWERMRKSAETIPHAGTVIDRGQT